MHTYPQKLKTIRLATFKPKKRNLNYVLFIVWIESRISKLESSLESLSKKWWVKEKLRAIYFNLAYLLKSAAELDFQKNKQMFMQIVFFSSIISVAIFSRLTLYAILPITEKESTSAQMIFGPMLGIPVKHMPDVEKSTNELISKLESAGLAPSPIGKIYNRTLDTQGIVMTLSNDNITIFEYGSAGEAARAGAVLSAAYQKIKSDAWKDRVHIYTHKNTLIFYMGLKEDIIEALDKNADLVIGNPHLSTDSDEL